jgi:hypothetical protein
MFTRFLANQSAEIWTDWGTDTTSKDLELRAQKKCFISGDREYQLQYFNLALASIISKDGERTLLLIHTQN